MMTLMSPGALARGKCPTTCSRPLVNAVFNLIECISVLVSSCGGGWFIVTPYLLGLVVSELVRHCVSNSLVLHVKEDALQSTCLEKRHLYEVFGTCSDNSGGNNSPLLSNMDVISVPA